MLVNGMEIMGLKSSIEEVGENSFRIRFEEKAEDFDVVDMIDLLVGYDYIKDLKYKITRISNKVIDISQKMNIFFDMDGVLCDFNKKYNENNNFSSPNWFTDLEPIKPTLKLLNAMLENDENINIISASPNENADNDKRDWLKKYLPLLDENKINICRIGDNKAEIIGKIDDSCILIDDYTNNLIEWAKNGGSSIKFVGLNDNPIGKHTFRNMSMIILKDEELRFA